MDYQPEIEKTVESLKTVLAFIESEAFKLEQENMALKLQVLALEKDLEQLKRGIES